MNKELEDCSGQTFFSTISQIMNTKRENILNQSSAATWCFHMNHFVQPAFQNTKIFISQSWTFGAISFFKIGRRTFQDFPLVWSSRNVWRTILHLNKFKRKTFYFCFCKTHSDHKRLRRSSPSCCCKLDYKHSLLHFNFTLNIRRILCLFSDMICV